MQSNGVCTSVHGRYRVPSQEDPGPYSSLLFSSPTLLHWCASSATFRKHVTAQCHFICRVAKRA